MNRETGTDKSPSLSIGTWVFGLAGVSFLLAIIVGALAIQGEPGKPVPLGSGGRTFMGEGCLECHSRMVRENDPIPGPRASELGSGGVADGLFGSSRIGPDLQNVAGSRTPAMLRTRLSDPSTLQPGTPMPSYAFLDSNEMDALLEFLETPIEYASKWETIREKNQIEPMVPDTVLAELTGRFDPETDMLVLPVEKTPQLAAVARGIYESRCAACHGSGAMRDSSLVWLFWRISDGVPGSSMPSWRDHISEDSIWLLAMFLKDFESEEPSTEIIGEEIQGSVVGAETLFAPEPSVETPGQVSTGDEDVGPGMTGNEITPEGPA